MDNRKNNKGTKGNAGGRPSKAEEQNLVEKLTPLIPKGYKALESGLDDDQSWAVKLFFEYLYGKPKQSVDVTSGGDKIKQQILSINPLIDSEDN
tara:strand:+ start:43 stop:324 length:282 start_codon:yes stop_codon:yes gene_type:complete